MRSHPLVLLWSVLLLSAVSSAVAKAPAAKPWDKLEGVVYKAQRWDDGDSFHVVTRDGRELILRLYFVDTPEEEAQYADRIADQAAYFGITGEQSMELGHRATAFTRSLLSRPFTVWTRWHVALGRSAQQRYYAMVVTGDNRDLAQELVKSGLARVYGTKTIPPTGHPSKAYEGLLQSLEAKAKTERRGGWGTNK